MTYEYFCYSCNTEFSADQKITDAPLKECKSCKSNDIQRLISRSSFVLTGSGWYRDGYGGKR